MQRLSRRIVPRVTVLGGLASLAVALHGLSLLQPAPWGAPALVATGEGFLVAWLDGTDDRVPVRVQAIGPDLRARGTAHTVGTGWTAARVVLDRAAAGDTAVRIVGDPAHPPWRVLATIDDAGRPRVRSGISGPRRPGEIRAGRASDDAPRPRRCGAPLGTAVRDARGEIRARLVLSPGAMAHLESVPHGLPVGSERIGPASCPGLSAGPCFASAADDRGVVIAWTRSRALGAELVLTRLGPAPAEAVVRRSPSFVLALGFAAFIALVAGLVEHSLARAVEVVRLAVRLRRRQGWVWVDGRPDDPAELVVGPVRPRGSSAFRMHTAAAVVQSANGERFALAPGTPLVITNSALRGEIPALAATAANLERVWVAGRFGADVRLGPYRDEGGRSIQPEVVSDRPLSVVRLAMLGRFAWSLVDAAALVAIGAGAFVAIL